MLHNEARELLVQGYEATHDVEGIAKESLIKTGAQRRKKW